MRMCHTQARAFVSCPAPVDGMRPPEAPVLFPVPPASKLRVWV